MQNHFKDGGKVSLNKNNRPDYTAKNGPLFFKILIDIYVSNNRRNVPADAFSLTLLLGK